MNRDQGRIADRFRAFVEESNNHGCPLYAHLAKSISDDSEVLALAAEVRRPPIPNTFFAAVHYLLLNEPDHPLRSFYGSLAEIPQDPADSYPDFRAFLLDRREKIIPILHARITQTNEVRRCSYLVPAFQWVYEKGGGRELALIDVGCSAGLHLLWDHYYYDYGRVQVGLPDSPVQIDCELRGTIRSPLPKVFPPCAYRIGVDLHPIDLRNPEERRWLEALIFPDHEDRRILLDTAIGVALNNPVAIVTGDAIDVLPGMLNQIPDSTTLCVYHCHALCQMNERDWKAFGDMLLSMSENREIFWLNAEVYEVKASHLRRGEAVHVKLANKDGHGRWMEWLEV